MNQGKTTAKYISLLERDGLLYYSTINAESENLLKIVMNFVKIQQEAEDILQELFVDVWKKRQLFNTEKDIRYYMYSKVRYMSLTYIQKKNKSEKNMEDFARTLENFYTPSIIEDSVTEERIEKLNRAITLLPESRRKVLLMSVYDELSRTEISNKLKISPQTVSTYLYKAIEQLKSILTVMVLFIVGVSNYNII